MQNIRKRAARLKKKGVAREAVTTAAAAAATPAPSPVPPQTTTAQDSTSGAPRKSPAFRLRPDQVQKQVQKKAELKAAFDQVYVDATNEWCEMVRTGKCGKGALSAAGVAETFNAKLPAECTKRLSGRALLNAVREGRVGEVPGVPGRKPRIPAVFVQSIAEYAQMQQIAGDEKKPRALAQAAVASVAGTNYEAELQTASQRAYLLRRVRLEFGLGVSTSVLIDDRRWKWLTSSNLTVWFAAYKLILFQWGFIPHIPDDIYELIEIAMEMLLRMVNGDESHQKLSNEGESSGPRSHVYVNLALGRAGKRKFEYQKHATILAWCNYGGEIGFPHLMLATDAAAAKKNAPETADEDRIRIRPEWTFGVPRVKGKFGCPEITTFEPTFVLNEKGGMASGGLQQWVECNLLKAYPNVAPTWTITDEGTVVSGPLFVHLDAGPDRYTDCSLQWRSRMWEMGVVMFPGLPNGTAANQVMDDLFGLYKTTASTVIDNVISERLAARASDPTCKVGIDFCDLGRVINGRPEDPVELRPFMRYFTPAKIRASTRRLGLAPIDL